MSGNGLKDSYPDTHKNEKSIRVFRLEDFDCPAGNEFYTKDFYRIILMRGRYMIHYPGKSIRISGSALLFFNPEMPYAIVNSDRKKAGFFCMFSKSFFTESVNRKLNTLPVYENPYLINALQDKRLSEIFTCMLAEMDSDYAYKNDLLRNYILEITHVALKSLSE